MYRQIVRKTIIVVMSILLSLLVVDLIYLGVAKYKNLEYRYTSVYKIFPVLVIKSDTKNTLLLQSNLAVSAANSFSNIIVLSSNNWKDNDLLAHEKEHVKQAIKGLFLIHTLLYLYNSKYRLKAEYAAYIAEKGNRLPKSQIIYNLATYYNLNLTTSQITSIIEEYDGI